MLNVITAKKERNKQQATIREHRNVLEVMDMLRNLMVVIASQVCRYAQLQKKKKNYN
jgi:hypothetical protein